MSTTCPVRLGVCGLRVRVFSWECCRCHDCSCRVLLVQSHQSPLRSRAGCTRTTPTGRWRKCPGEMRGDSIASCISGFMCWTFLLPSEVPASQRVEAQTGEALATFETSRSTSSLTLCEWRVVVSFNARWELISWALKTWKSLASSAVLRSACRARITV